MESLPSSGFNRASDVDNHVKKETREKDLVKNSDETRLTETKKYNRPNSYFVEATKRSRKKRKQERDFYLNRNDLLQKEHAFLQSRIKTLEDELLVLTKLRTDAKTPTCGGQWRQQILNQSLRSQVSDYRTLCTKYKAMFMMTNKVVSKSELLHAAKSNVYFLLERMGFFLKHTQGLFSQPVEEIALNKRTQLYKEMLKLCLREYAVQTGKIHVKLPDEVDVENWFPEFDFRKLDSKVTVIQHENYEKWVRVDVKDLPVSRKTLEMMSKRIDIFTVIMRANNAARRHFRENGHLEEESENAVGHSEAYVPLQVLDEQDILGHFSSTVDIEYKRPSTSYFSDVAFLSVCDFSPQSKSSFLIQSVLPECTTEIDKVEGRGGLFMRGITVEEGSTPSRSHVTLLFGLKQSMLFEGDELSTSFVTTLNSFGAKGFMKPQQHSPGKTLNVIGAMFKCSLYVCNYFENWGIPLP